MLVETDFRFDLRFLGRMGVLRLVWIRVIFHETRERIADEVPAVLEVTTRDQFAFRMLREPPFTAPQQFLHFVVADPTMLIVVQDRQQDIEVGEQITQRDLGFEGEAKIAALAPIWEFFIERPRLNRNCVAQRARKGAAVNLRLRNRELRQSPPSAEARHRPVPRDPLPCLPLRCRMHPQGQRTEMMKRRMAGR